MTIPTSPCSGVSRHRAFTLIELLAVITIIGILAAIIIPVAGKVRKSAYKATCLSNLRQLSLVWRLQVDENRGIMPFNFKADGEGLNGHNNYMSFLGTFPENRKILNCPGYVQLYNISADTLAGKHYDNGFFQAFYTYATNRDLNRHQGDATDVKRSVESVISPAKTVLMGDGYKQTAEENTWNLIGSGRNPGNPVAPHDGLVNISFVDGHVESRKEKDPLIMTTTYDTATYLFWFGEN
ncbi:MAG: prepilin-type N-terminal cleavage/methylation domain-containing protein [Opitutaceae bacterium]|jgi:prepilin-type N-terminal cleavage/methylation domain-containing protein/prepilin-type processing-associated H-X9-DG protein|nr:prepilin-type N-terminal cleavage/methylation domain-containing protein [Opitutaceae bacterium]